MTPVAIALGSNIGDRLANLQASVDRLSRWIEVCGVSHIYETAPMYVEDQPAFCNAALLGRTSLYPLALLRKLKETELEVGRRPAERFGPREIDIDLVYYGCAAYRFGQDEHVVLTVPHPRTPERRFVLQPLFDLDPELRLPGLPSLQEMLAATQNQAEDVRIVNDAALSIHRS